MRVELDRNRCEGHALCEASAPEFFSVDEDGHLTIATVRIQAGDVARVQAAVLSCPVAALKLAETSSPRRPQPVEEGDSQQR